MLVIGAKSVAGFKTNSFLTVPCHKANSATTPSIACAAFEFLSALRNTEASACKADFKDAICKSKAAVSLVLSNPLKLLSKLVALALPVLRSCPILSFNASTDSAGVFPDKKESAYCFSKIERGDVPSSSVSFDAVEACFAITRKASS